MKKEKVNLVALVGKQMRTGNRLNAIEKQMPSKGDGEDKKSLRNLGNLKAELDKIEFDIQEDLMQTLKEVFEKERKPGQSFNDWFKSKPLDELKRLSLANGGTVEEKYGDLIDAFEKEDTVKKAVAVGEKSVSITFGTSPDTNVTEDQYANGYIFFNTAAGSGTMYRIRQHNSADVSPSPAVDINLMDGDTLVEALTTSSKAGLVANPFMHVIPSPGGAQTGRTVGFTTCDVADNSYFWAQTWGEAAVEVDGTLVIFTPVRMSDGQAGAVEAYSSDTDSEEQQVGFATNILAADEHFQFVHLTIAP